MKRLLWLTCLCCMGPLAIVGCGDDDSGGSASEDGGMSNPDINQISNDIDGINKMVDDLNGNVTDLGTQVDGIDKMVGDLGGQVDDVAARLAKLENPTLPNCSATDPSVACKPDGLDVVSTDITKIVAQICALEVNCCTPTELALKYGAGIQTAADCEKVFFDLLANGFSPNLFNDQYGYVINNVIEIAQALNSKRVKIAINTKQVGLCVASLKKRECPKLTDVTVETPKHCTPDAASEPDDPCDPMLIVDGLQAEGEPCDVGSLNVPQCKDKLVCRTSDADEGLCATPAAEGDGCQNDFECDEDLFCNHTTAQCQALGDVGDACAYIDPTFKVNTSQIDPRNNPQGNATSIDCKPGLTCDPKSKKCVAACSNGSICYAYTTDNGNVGCPDKMVCNVTENPDLYDTWSAGVCRATTAKGKPCTNNTECATGNCGYNVDNDIVCLDALTANGGTCDTAGQADATCKSGYCNRAGKCASTCHYDENENLVGCPSGYYCAEQIGYDDMEVLQFACEPKGAASDDCNIDYNSGSDPHNDASCTSGFCDTSMTPTVVGTGNDGKCGAKAAVDGACTTGRLQQCANTQWCNAAVCVAFIADGVVCANQPGSCGEPASYCRYDGVSAYACHPYGDEGDACDQSYTYCMNGLICDPTDLLCRKTGNYPDGATCSSDSQCAHAWCNTGDISGYKCAKPIADTKACDSATASRCVSGDYCKYPDDDTAGKCVKRLTAGQACAPRFNGMDCLTNLSVNPFQSGNCTLSNDKFVCDSNAVPDGKLFCDGP